MKRITSLAALLALVSWPAAAYEVPVHRKMTQEAAQSSLFLINDRVRVYGISQGIRSLDHQLGDGYVLHFGGQFFLRRSLSLQEWMQLGVDEEDDPMKMLNHFYNPLATSREEGLKYGLWRGKPSLDWGLESESYLDQQYSLRDAKKYLYDAILGSHEETRKWSFIQFFRALGHVVHWVQDLASPQHTRNEGHPPVWNPSVYETWTNEHRDELDYTGYPPVELSKPELYWTTCPRGDPCPTGKGLANYSNRGFITQGSNFSGNRDRFRPDPRFPFPNHEGARFDKRSVSDLLGSRVTDEKLSGVIWFVHTPVPDYHTGSTTNEARISTYSIFDHDLGERGVFSFNNFNSQSIQKLLVPRAVGYSAGLLNRFFRGKIEISLPGRGVYAYADHGSAAGFSSLRATLKNVTPADAMVGGELIAAVKFHHNGCYKPDLSGEFTTNPDGSLKTPCSSYRSKEEEMVRSKPLPLPRLDSGQQQEFTFEFPTPIPMDATDVYLQVVYRGPLGPDEADGLAVGARDLSEPTFLTTINALDVYQLPTAPGSLSYEFYRPEVIKSRITEIPYSQVDLNKNGVYDPPYDENVDGGPISFELSIQGRTGLTKIATIPAMPKGRFSQFAVLADATTQFRYSLLAHGSGYNMDRSDHVANPKVAQLDYSSCDEITRSGCTYLVSTVSKLRELYYFGATIYWTGHPPRWSEWTDIPESKQPDATKPVPLTFITPTLLSGWRPATLDDEPAGNVAISVAEPSEPSRALMIQLP